ncbi:unnamed protein product [Mytilus coruscus]|uniref:C3H1-type domain-containing protein n=1 Tax=Mytilus coruscus TaxID=42192 RepID=A0A6J8CPN6_MYTCO|nr:unnamed protein product [Mytilus coruscus]
MADNNEELPASSSAGAHADINVSSGTNNRLPAPTEPEVTDNYIREVLGQLKKQQPQHGGHLITSHDMVSVFFYDREYRRLQSMHRFRWGTDIPHIQMVYLKPRAAQYPQQTNTQPKGSGASTRGARNYASHTSSGKEICRKFNSRYGCTLASCKFEHACSIFGCGQKHSAGSHQSSNKKKLGNTVKPFRALDLRVWSRELANDFDREFLLNGIEFGFDIIDCDQLPSSIVSKNSSVSLTKYPLYEKAHTQVLNEIECGNYKFTSSDPCIISPVGVIPKRDGGIRLIHDCSRPKGSSVNSLVSEIEKQRFQTLDDAAKLVTKKNVL